MMTAIIVEEDKV